MILVTLRENIKLNEELHKGMKIITICKMLHEFFVSKTIVILCQTFNIPSNGFAIFGHLSLAFTKQSHQYGLHFTKWRTYPDHNQVSASTNTHCLSSGPITSSLGAEYISPFNMMSPRATCAIGRDSCGVRSTSRLTAHMLKCTFYPAHAYGKDHSPCRPQHH